VKGLNNYLGHFLPHYFKILEKGVIMSVNIPKPSNDEVEKYLDNWKKLTNYVDQENSVKKVFSLYPNNNDINEILIKVAVLNDFYSTNIYKTYEVAKYIFALKIDDRLKNNDLNLVKDIASITFDDKTSKYYYSFATKYCSHHKPDIYPICDGFVRKVLMYFKNIDKFNKFIKEDLKNYIKFREIIISFLSYYNLNKYTFKEIDKYLWLLGKEYFNKEPK